MVCCTGVLGYTARGYTMDEHYCTAIVHCCMVVVPG
jgi:hypothetical protein